jgi:hypothetical protein
MKKLLLASVLAIASFPGYAVALSDPDPNTGLCPGASQPPSPDGESHCDSEGADQTNRAPARVTVAPPYQGPPPIGWVYRPYTICGWPFDGCFVNVQADGLNVRVAPNGPPVMSLVNGTPLVPLQKQGDWLLVAPACDLTPTWAWSWNAGVPLNRCWVYF